MSIKIGVAPGNWAWKGGGQFFFRFVDSCEELGWDSFWLSDRLISLQPTLEPVTTLASVAARTKRIKFGTSVLVPALRNPTVLAKELATVDFLSSGRLLPAIGLGSKDDREYQAAGVKRSERTGRTEEAIGLMRRLWSEESVTHHGQFYTLNNVTVNPKPLFQPALPIWIGGRTKQAIQRVARLGDGWLASSITSDEAAEGISSIKHMLKAEGRHIENDHYGVLLACYISTSREKALAAIQSHGVPLRENLPLEHYVAAGSGEDILRVIKRYQENGISKFVLRLACDENEGLEQLQFLAEMVAVPINTSGI